MIKEILVFILRFLFLYNNRNKNPRKWYKIKTKKYQLINIFLFIKDPVLHKNKDNKNGLTIT